MRLQQLIHMALKQHHAPPATDTYVPPETDTYGTPATDTYVLLKQIHMPLQPIPMALQDRPCTSSN